MQLHTTVGQTAAAGTSTLVQTLAACVFGVLVLLGAGFMPMDAAHNAAHDMRHTAAFPCH